MTSGQPPNPTSDMDLRTEIKNAAREHVKEIIIDLTRRFEAYFTPERIEAIARSFFERDGGAARAVVEEEVSPVGRGVWMSPITARSSDSTDSSPARPVTPGRSRINLNPEATRKHHNLGPEEPEEEEELPAPKGYARKAAPTPKPPASVPEPPKKTTEPVVVKLEKNPTPVKTIPKQVPAPQVPAKQPKQETTPQKQPPRPIPSSSGPPQTKQPKRNPQRATQPPPRQPPRGNRPPVTRVLRDPLPRYHPTHADATRHMVGNEWDDGEDEVDLDDRVIDYLETNRKLTYHKS